MKNQRGDTMTKEEKFFNALKDIFVGAKVEGESGYINLMRIKSNYYEKKIFPQLQNDIDQALEPFPEFREELFDKLYNFFYRYFSESGSIYFRYTPFHQNVYEKVYTDDRDVILFWKTHMLYYVKTDRLFNNLDVEVDDFKFFFDVSTLQHKKANEKKQIIYELKEVRKDKTIVFNVVYSERGRITKSKDIIKALNKEDIKVTEEILDKAFKVFEKQSEVDYFINKNAKEFLKEQFNLWLYQYVFSGESEWTDKRIKQLQVLKDIAYKIIDFISQFEDELVKVWNKPKFVLNSNYVITLDRIADKDIELIEELIKHKNFENQEEEWKELEIIDEKFEKNQIFENRLDGKQLKKEYQHLPIDTKYFKDLELKILSLFDDLDNALDGWLIKSENYQALNTILPKFKEKVQTIYIDPPFNTGDDFFYKDKFQDSTWITLLFNRLNFMKEFLRSSGNFYMHLDRNANYYGRILLNDTLGKANFKAEISWDTCGTTGFKSSPNNWIKNSDSILHYCKDLDNNLFIKPYILINIKDPKKVNEERKEKKLGWLDILEGEDGKFYIETWENTRFIRKCIDVENKLDPVGMIWTDILSFLYTQVGNNESFFFKTQKPEHLLRRIIQSSCYPEDIVMDFFAGVGTTIAVAHKLNRRWIGIEMGNNFDTFYYDGIEKKIGILGRMKIVVFGDQRFSVFGHLRHPQLSRNINWQGGGFFKYYELEQYEDTLRNVKYDDYDLFNNPYQDIYNQYVFMRDLKMLEALEIDYENNKVNVDLSKLYKNIDIPETLSNLTGKWIKKITSDYVEFEDGEKIDIKNLDYKLIKPLIWW
jgi:adenine-specific DNA-methyltransferase